MSLRNKIFILVLPFVVSSCGFQPLYGKRSADEESVMAVGIKVDPILGGGRPAQLLKEDLEDRLNDGGVVPPHPAYRLVMTFSSAEGAIGVARDGTISRYNVYLTSNYTLYRTSDSKPVTKGTVSHVSSYNNVTNAYFSTFVAEQDSITHGITELSEIYRSRIAAYLTGPDSGKPDKTVSAPDTGAAPIYSPFNPLGNNPLSTTPYGAGSPFTSQPASRN